MKIRMIRLAIKWCFPILILILACCAHQVSVEELSNEWLARPLSELKQAMKSPDSYASKIHWQEKTYPLANGYYAYVEPISPDCSIHWSINQRDMIVDYRAIGSDCNHKNEGSNSPLKNVPSPKTSTWN